MASDKPVRLTVSEIRQRIFEVSGTAAQGAGSMAGQLFHAAASAALEEEHPAGWKSVLTGALDEQEWLRSLYDQVLGPELTRLQPSLRDNGGEVLTLWRGVQSFTHWFCGLLAEAMRNGTIRYDAQTELWLESESGYESIFQSEREVEAVFSHPDWSQDVVVTGRLDTLIRPAPDRWCVVEFKLGGGHPQADAAQACLYYELLGHELLGHELPAQELPDRGGSSAAIVGFGGADGIHETVLKGEWIEQARPALLALIGALAGVARSNSSASAASSKLSESSPSESGPSETVWPKIANETEIEMGKKLVRALREFNAEAKLASDPLVGPAFVRYLLEPGRGVPASRILRQGSNLRTRLHLDQEPLIGSSEGGRIAVDVQRPEREFVPFGDLFGALLAKRSEQKYEQGNACVLAGVDLKGRVHFIDLSRESPHVLAGGETGSGKSEWLRSAMASLIVTNDPSTLRLILVDPKKNALTELAGSPFLWRSDALVDAPDGSSIFLIEDLIEEIARRNELFKQAAADDLAHYRRKTAAPLPRIVYVVDEFADLLMGGGKKQREAFEHGFVRIAQMGRAAGIHLILATQHASRQVVSGVLKANLTGKVAFHVHDQIASRVLLDQSGAQNLLGKGDLLLSAGYGSPVRLQSPWLSEEERRRIFRHVLGRDDAPREVTA
jgi:hypothetical protein